MKTSQRTIETYDTFLENFRILWYEIFYLFLNGVRRFFDKNKRGAKLLNRV